MAKVFVDVGGFEGESASAALDPGFGFSRVYCFEPVKSCFDTIRRSVSSQRLEVIRAGLLDKRCQLPIYYPGTLGASIFADAPAIEGASAASEVVDFQRASDFFRDRIPDSDRVWMKLNCEGAEVAILEDLITSGQARKLHEVLIDFDAAKIPSARASVDMALALLATVTFSFHFPEEVQYGMINNYGGIHNWLRMTGAQEIRSPRALIASLAYQGRQILNPRYNGYYKIRLLRRLGLSAPPPLRPSSLRDRIRATEA